MNGLGEKMGQPVQMLQKLYETVIEYVVKYGFQVLAGIVILFVGYKLANWAARLFTDFCQKKKLDITLTKFLAGIVKSLVLVFAGMIAIEKFGVTISPFVASISALIFGASFAIQAPLSNYAAGLMVILTRPFVVGNTISIKGVGGLVQEVKLANTVLVTEDGEKITIPNKEIVGQILINSAEYKIVEKTVGISYSDDPEKAIAVIREVLARETKVSQAHAPIIGIENFGESSIDIGMRYWVPTKEYFQTLYAVNMALHKAFRKANLTIPFPQREVRMINK